MNEWKEYKLGDFIKVKHGYAFPGEHITPTETDKILVTPGNFHIGGGFKSDKFKYYNSNDFPQEYILHSGDIIVTMTDLSKDTDTLGYSAKVPNNNSKLYLHNQRIGLLQFKSDKVCPDFVYWLMRTKEYQSYIVGSASGTSIMHTSPSRIEAYSCLFPPLEEQKQIAGILSSLDDKIDLLNKENATLEAMAETLFRHLFIENPNPTWKEGKLTDYIKIIGGGTPKTSEPSYWNGNIGWLSGGDISLNHKNYIFNVEKYITQKGVDNSAVHVLPEDSMVISARGTVGKYCLLGKPMVFSQSNYGILPNINGCYYFTYLLVSQFVEKMKNAAYGSVFDTITTKTFESIDVTMPNEKEVIVAFNNQVKPFFDKIKSNQQQIQTLSSQRDTLLPRLMSGEVEINRQ